jgi:hypothetical protein
MRATLYRQDYVPHHCARCVGNPSHKSGSRRAPWMALREAVQRLASDELLRKLTLKFDAVTAAPYHGFSLSKTRQPWSIPPRDLSTLRGAPHSGVNIPRRSTVASNCIFTEYLSTESPRGATISLGRAPTRARTSLVVQADALLFARGVARFRQFEKGERKWQQKETSWYSSRVATACR